MSGGMEDSFATHKDVLKELYKAQYAEKYFKCEPHIGQLEELVYNSNDTQLTLRFESFLERMYFLLAKNEIIINNTVLREEIIRKKLGKQ